MRKTITPCLIQKKNDHFLIKFPEYPDCTLKCANLEDCLNVAPSYLSAYMLNTEQEFVAHTRPLTPKTDNKDQLFTLLNCDMDEMQDILSDFHVSAKEFVDWLTVRADEPKEKQPEENKEETPKQEDVSPMPEEQPIESSETSVETNDDEFDVIFNNTNEDVSSQIEDIPVDVPEINEEEPQKTVPVEEVINKNEYRQRPAQRQVKQNETENKEPDVNSDAKDDDNKKDKKNESLKGKVKDMDFEKKNNSGVFGVIQEEELEFTSNSKNINKNNTPANTSNRHQQNFNKKKKPYPNKKKKSN